MTFLLPRTSSVLGLAVIFSLTACSEPSASNGDQENAEDAVVVEACDCLKEGLSKGEKKFCRESKRSTAFLEEMRKCGLTEVGGVSAVTNMPDDGQYTMDVDQSRLEWQGRKATLSETGLIPIRTCTFSIEGGRLTSGTMLVEMNGIQATSQKGQAARELGQHLRSADFFDVSTYPTAAYTITSSKTDGRGNLSVQGKLNIKGQTKEVEAMMTFASADPVVVSVSLAFNRADFDVRFGSGSFFDNLGDDLISDEVNMRMALVENVSLRKGN
jgi:polyisoprenoid-binding protein YceI